MQTGPPSGSLFARWFWLVYLPLGLLLVCLAVFFVGYLPAWGRPILIGLGLYGLIALRLLIERRRRGMLVPAPKNVLAGMAWIGGLASTGAVLAYAGGERLSTDTGLALTLAGGFLMFMSVMAPIFKIIDLLLRTTGRAVGRRAFGRGSDAGASERPERSSIRPRPEPERQPIPPRLEPERVQPKSPRTSRSRSWYEKRAAAARAPSPGFGARPGTPRPRTGRAEPDEHDQEPLRRRAEGPG